MQLKLTSVMKDAGNGVALKEGSARQPRARSRGLKDFPIASSKSKMKPGDLGFLRGEVVYILCPFHKERTPSCVIYYKGRSVPFLHWKTKVPGVSVTRRNHFHCYGCAKTGNLRELFAALRNPPPVKIWSPFDPFTENPF